MSASIPFTGNVFQEIFSVHFVLAPGVPLAIVSPCPLLSSRMGGTAIKLSFLSLLPCYWPRWQLVILFFEREKHLGIIARCKEKPMTVCFLPEQVLAHAGLRLHTATPFLSFDHTIIDSTYNNSISGNGTFDKCIIMLYTLTRRQ